jgi:hypothetical protein
MGVFFSCSNSNVIFSNLYDCVATDGQS